MMKNRLLFFILLISLFSYAQQGNITINWTEKATFSIGSDISVTIPQSDTRNISYNHERKELFYALSLPASSEADKNSLRITNIIYESVTAAQLGDLSLSSLPSGINAKLSSKKARNDWFTVITLSPIIKEG